MPIESHRDIQRAGQSAFEAGGGGSAPLNLYDEWDETNFGVGGATVPPFAGAAVSTGTSNTAIPAASLNGKNWNGVFLRSSTTANGGYRYQTTSLVAMYFGKKSAKWVGTWRHRTQFTGVLGRAGFHDATTSADAVDGAYFEINGNVASAKTASNSVRTTAGSTYTLALDLDYTFDVEVNEAGTAARYRIYENGGAAAVYDVTITTNIPNTSARTFGAGVIFTEASTTALDMIILYYMGFGTINGYLAARTVPTAAAPAETVGSSLPTSGAVVLNFADINGTVQTIALTGAVTFSTANIAPGRRVKLRLSAGASARGLTWPVGFVAIGALLPTSLAAGKVLRVTLEAVGTTDSSVDAVAAESV